MNISRITNHCKDHATKRNINLNDIKNATVIIERFDPKHEDGRKLAFLSTGHVAVISKDNALVTVYYERKSRLNWLFRGHKVNDGVTSDQFKKAYELLTYYESKDYNHLI